MKEFKLRASQASKLATLPRAKKDQEAGLMSQTSITYLNEWMQEQIYGRGKQILTKQMHKGITMEPEAIALLSQHEAKVMEKNEKFFENDYFTGTPDVITEDTIYDTKCSWDHFSFPLFDSELEKVYFYQMQVYMHLTEKEKAVVAYCLVNTPDELLYGDEPVDYEQFDINLRVKLFHVDYDPKVIDFLQSQVINSRKYIEQKWNTY